MKHLGAEVRKLGGFLVGNLREDASLPDHLRVSAQDSVHVGPNPKLFGVESRGNEGARIIGTSTSERSPDSIRALRRGTR